jgi:ferric-dicitrate binding protein FerR (iron transport regulator)
MGRTTGRFSVILAAFLFTAGFHGALAQSEAGCTLQQVGGTQRQILHCGDGIAITAEAGARYQLIDRNRDGAVDKVSLSGKAILLDVDSARVEGGFQVVTPQAIAAVRGTRWAVDVQGGKTSVLVLRGRVAVSRPNTSAGVVLGQGQGVDVDGGAALLVVKTWPKARVSALMARLGQ